MLSVTGDLDRQLNISALHHPIRSETPASLWGDKTAHPAAADSALGGQDGKRCREKHNIRTCCRNKWVMRYVLVEVGSRGLAGDFLLLSLSRAAVKSGVEAVCEGIKTYHLSVGRSLWG